MKFYQSEKNNRIYTAFGAGEDTGREESLKELVPGAVDAAQEKHVPVVEQNGNRVTVKVGAVEHPMLENHYIEWIVLETTNGSQRKNLKPGEKPVAEFVLADGEQVVAAYEHCNLHGLWKK